MNLMTSQLLLFPDNGFLNLPTAKAGGFPFLLRCRLLGSLAYWVQGRFMRPAHWSIKNQWAAQPIPVPDIHRGIGIGVRLVSATGTGVGVFMTFVDGATMGAGLAGVVRTNFVHRHTRSRSQCLVAYKRLQLKKRPVVPILSGIRSGCWFQAEDSESV